MTGLAFAGNADVTAGIVIIDNNAAVNHMGRPRRHMWRPRRAGGTALTGLGAYPTERHGYSAQVCERWTGVNEPRTRRGHVEEP